MICIRKPAKLKKDWARKIKRYQEFFRKLVVCDAQQRTDYAALATQHAVALLFYDESLTLRLTKMVPLHTPEDSDYILQTAEQVLQTIPLDQRDFDAAKQS